ncbi:MAG TPA: class I SAM-dependent methyltransferase [Verrucomicrobiae bacterium]|nr:class I SAM-dependent methyltransferase [Verrucomicrobiae bacterium]
MTANQPEELRRIYGARFEKNSAYRQRVWRVLIREFFQAQVSPSATVLDLGCGYGEFINQIQCGRKLAMDLNPDAPRFLAADVRFLQQDCSTRWQCEDQSLDVVFTSNFFEHLPSKAALKMTLEEACRCLKPGGRLLAMGPNIRFLRGDYWDFWDHHLALSDRSLAEGLENCGFTIAENHDRFLPYTMVNQREHPLFLLSLYLKLRPAWKFFGRQFFIVAAKA